MFGYFLLFGFKKCFTAARLFLFGKPENLCVLHAGFIVSPALWITTAAFSNYARYSFKYLAVKRDFIIHSVQFLHLQICIFLFMKTLNRE